MKIFIPYKGKTIDLEVYLTEILKLHQQKTPYWQKTLNQNVDDLISSRSLEETLYNLSKLEVDQNLLRNDWLLFKPIDLKNPKCSFSSGTTGPQKYCFWSSEYIREQANYLYYYIGKEAKVKHAIIQGPSSVYKDVNELAINLLDGIPYFVGLRVEGLKPVIERAMAKGPQELIKIIKEYFETELGKTKHILEKDPKVNFMRSAFMMLSFFEEFFGDKKNVDSVMVSGLGYSPENHKLLQQKFKTVIPSYGYFAFGDALGKYINGNLDYHPAFPYAIFTVVKENGEITKYGERGNPLFIIARPDLFLVLKENNEYVSKAPSKDEFPWDGIRNPFRKL